MAVASSVGLLLAGALVAACASILGIGERLADDLAPDAEAASDERAPSSEEAGPSDCPATTTCVKVPDGWELVALSVDTRPPCPAGFDTPSDVVALPDGRGCTCTCSEIAPGSCASVGAATTFRAYPAAGCSASTSTTPLTVLDGGCGVAVLVTTPDVRIPTPVATPPGCAADAGPSRVTDGRACIARGAPCPGGVCTTGLPTTERRCVSRVGDVACPGGYPANIPAGASTIEDTRACGTCTCTPGSVCGAPTVRLFRDGKCMTSELKLPGTGSCEPVEAGVTYNSYRYTGTAPTCAPSVPPLRDGGITLTQPRTICCEDRE